MIRNHSFLAAVQEIMDYSEEIDLVRVGLIGDPHSGKSTMLEAISHIIHQKAKLPYAVRIFSKKDLLKFKDTIATLESANYILGFDDASFLEADASKREIDIIKQAISTIRHLPGGQDKKIILFVNYHSVKALSPYLRQADFRFFTTVGSDTERNNMVDIIGKKSMNLISTFMKLRRQAIVKKHFSMRIGPKEIFSYKWRNPWIPVIFFNNASARFIISPTRQWLEPTCSICSTSRDDKETEISMDKFFDEAEYKFQERIWKSACRLVLLGNGINVFSPNIKQGVTYLNRALLKKTIRLEDIATKYNLEVKQSRLRKKLDGVLSDEPKPILEESVGDVLQFDTDELKTLVKKKKPRDNWLEPFWKQSKKNNLEKYAKLQERYRLKQEPDLAIKITALCGLIKNQA